MNCYRVIYVNRGILKIKNESEEIVTHISGNYRSNIVLKSQFPVVGDYVVIDDSAVITNILERKNSLSRKRSGKKYEQQVIASNIDLMFITISLNKLFDIRKIYRLFILATTNYIRPIIILTKSDLCNNIEKYINIIKTELGDIEYIVSGLDVNDGIIKIKELLLSDITAVFVGPSGVGKSTLVNQILNQTISRTGEVRNSDDKGRHTTTNKQLYYLENGAAIIDTPGIREIGLWINEKAFVQEDEINKIAQNCRFRNCTHQVEPGCAVLAALNSKSISSNQYREYLKLTREIQYAEIEQGHMIKKAHNKNKRIKEMEHKRKCLLNIDL